MSTHNICFHREIIKILCGYPLLSVAMNGMGWCKNNRLSFTTILLGTLRLNHTICDITSAACKQMLQVAYHLSLATVTAFLLKTSCLPKVRRSLIYSVLCHTD